MRDHLQFLLLIVLCVFDMNCTVHSEAKTDFSTGTDGLLLTRKPVQDLGRKETETLRQKVARKWVDGNQVVFRVVNGRQATLGQFPYQVSFRRRVGKTNVFMNFCGGAVITPSEVLSAAHCFRHGETVADQLGAWCGRNSDRAKDEVVKRVFAVAGTVFSASRYHEPNETTGADAHKHGQWRRVRAVRFPSSYHFPQDDIAVVFLIGSYEWTDTVKPIPYAETYKDYKGSCLVSGYGRIKGGHRSPALLYAALRMMRPSKCSLVHERDMSRMICSADTVADTAKGDSGGPLVCKNTGDPKEEQPLGILVGVVSGGRKDVKFGSYFTRVSSFTDFINHTIKMGPDHATQPTLSRIIFVACAVHFLYCVFIIYLN